MFRLTIPSDDFRNTADTTRLTKAVLVGVTSGATAFTIDNPAGDTINFVSGMELLPIQTRVAVAGSGITIVYLY